MSLVQIQMAESKDDQLKGLMKQFRKDKCLKDKSIDEIRKIAMTYQRLDNEARKGQHQERIRRDMGIKIPIKDIKREQDRIVDDVFKDLNYFEIAAVSSHYLEYSNAVHKGDRMNELA